MQISTKWIAGETEKAFKFFVPTTSSFTFWFPKSRCCVNEKDETIEIDFWEGWTVDDEGEITPSLLEEIYKENPLPEPRQITISTGWILSVKKGVFIFKIPPNSKNYQTISSSEEHCYVDKKNKTITIEFEHGWTLGGITPPILQEIYDNAPQPEVEFTREMAVRGFYGGYDFYEVTTPDYRQPEIEEVPKELML